MNAQWLIEAAVFPDTAPGVTAAPDDADSLTLALLDDHTLEAMRGASAKDLGCLADVILDDPSALTRIGGRADFLPALKLSPDPWLIHAGSRVTRSGYVDQRRRRSVGGA